MLFMKCTFYRPTEVKEMYEIVEKLEADFQELKSGKVSEKEALQYLEELLPQAKVLKSNPADYSGDREPPVRTFGAT